ncbi:MAG: tRNA (adenosine(37)-N6)-threonylcarbamoyltransferase complex ATPase subunit type 1 TsaE [Planctomycetes bacterium]|nr:tRNA (adenosine(37)-N6)-threonylcarbamoyltransferase complex ATPase subunit type 1 TsaE [Planctomycetota bacterium]
MEASGTHFEREFATRSPEETEGLARELARHLEPGTVIALDGELGSGKTCFVRGLARGLDAVDAVASPTYTLMHAYRGRLPLYHFDAWMEGRAEAFLEGGGAEWLGADGVAAIEWAERVERHLPLERLHVSCAHAAGGGRRIRIAVRGDEVLSDRGRRWVESLRALGPGPFALEDANTP